MTEETDQQPAAAEPGPLTESAAAELLQQMHDEEEQQPQIGSARATATAAEEAQETIEVEPEAEAEESSEPASEDADEETTEAEDSDDIYVHGNARTRLRDGTEISVGDLKKLADEAREYKRQEAEFTAKQREFEAKQAQIAQHEQVYASTIKQAIAALQNTLPAAPDPRLLHTDPIAYLQLKEAREDKLREIAGLQQASNEQEQKAQLEQSANFQKYLVNEQSRLFDRVPELRNEGKRREFYNNLLATGREYGFSEQEINNIHDHRTMLLIRDAMRARKLDTSKPKAVEKAKNAKPVAKPEARTAPVSSIAAKHKKLFQRAQKTRSIDDVGALLAELD